MDQRAARTLMVASSSFVQIFGYGSLVNRRARRHDLAARPAAVRGWRRTWSHCVETENGKVCALTIAPNDHASVAGVVLIEHRQNLAELDARERGYERISVSLSEDSMQHEGLQTFTYSSTATARRQGSREFPIWRSYLECVLAGFFDLGGDQAVHEFVASTDGWDTPILDDRARPRYMRFVALPDETRQKIDQLVQSHRLHATQFDDPTLPSLAPRNADTGDFA